MRMLIANDGLGDAGGVQSYLDAVSAGLARRGHALARVHRDPEDRPSRPAEPDMPRFSVAGPALEPALDAIRAWRPDVVFSHNMNRLDVDAALAGIAPVVKFMHGYFGTCIGGLKHHAFPAERPCDRVFGPACLALYLPCHCGQLSVRKLVDQYGWAVRQRAMFSRYRAIVVASEHMRREYLRHGADAARVHANPLFPTHAGSGGASPAPEPTVAFLGRMTPLKGGDLLVRAVAAASAELGRPIALLMIGDGPARHGWEALARGMGVAARFTGWVDGDARWPLVRMAHLMAVPSVWPEPFGLVGLEAAALGVPAIAFDVGGIREWLRPGTNGVLVEGARPTAEALARGLVDAFRRPEALCRMRGAARAVADDLSLDRHLDRLEAILRS
jgi:glycosyltransferase involved in cell wall biosynthesis